MMINIILGTGYLSKNLNKKIQNSKIYSSNELIENIKLVNNLKKYNLIINSFYSSQELNNFKSYEKFINKSFLEVSKVLDLIDPRKVNKIIYTSSSAVYGSIIDNSELKDNFNRNLYSFAKLYCENLIKNFCNKHNKNFIIARVFNCYGEKNKFSILNKILFAFKNKKKMVIYNEGRAIRDFINVNDVGKIYNLLLKEFKQGTYDIGTGQGIKIIDLLNEIKFPKNKIIFKKTNNQEIDYSVANINNFKKKIRHIKFYPIENFFKIKNKKLFKYKSKDTNKLIPQVNNVIIYGAGYAGKKLAKKILKNEKENLTYFVDDDLKKIGKYIFNKKVISFKQLIIAKKKLNIDKILIAIPSLKYAEKSKLYEKLFPLSSSISSLPSKEYFRNKSINLNDLVDINVEEILNREIFQISKKYMEKYQEQTVLITGGGGSIGSEICKQLQKSYVKKIIIIDNSEYNLYTLKQNYTDKKIITYLNDINDTKFVRRLIINNKVNFIFHAAAYKHVELLEENQGSAIKNNFIGTLSVLKAIKGLNVNLSIISTDKAVYPKNLLGITKRASEIIALNYGSLINFKNSKINIVRFGNVFGSKGSAIETFVNQIKNQKDITLTSYNMKRYFMSISEACNLVIQSAVLGYRNKIFTLEMGKQIKIFSLIKKILKFYNIKDDTIKIKVIGPKPGEKISEKLSFSKKKLKTKIPKLYISIEKNIKIKNLDEKLKKIEKLIMNYKINKALTGIKLFLK